jgi:hypothetical protein
MITLAFLSSHDRSNERDTNSKKPCPITIQGLLAFHNAVVKFKLDKGEGNLGEFLSQHKSRDSWIGWNEYVKRYATRLLLIQNSQRLEPVTAGEDEFALNPPLLIRKGEHLAKISCALKPSKDNISFANEYEAAHKKYSTTNHAKTSIEQLVNIHRLAQMEIQYLASCDTEWKDSGAERGCDDADGAGAKSMDRSSNSESSDELSILQQNSERRLLDKAIRASKDSAPASAPAAASSAPPSAVAANGSAPASDPAAASSAPPSADAAPASTAAAASSAPPPDKPPAADAAKGSAPASAKGSAPASAAAAADAAPPDSPDNVGDCSGDLDLDNILTWDHRSGVFPLTDSALQLMAFPPFPRPKYYFAAGIILFLRASRTPKEEEVFQILSNRWQEWCGTDLDYESLILGPPKKGPCAYNAEETNWCIVRLKVLEMDIKDVAVRARLGLPIKEKRKNHETGKESEPAQPEPQASERRKRRSAERSEGNIDGALQKSSTTKDLEKVSARASHIRREASDLLGVDDDISTGKGSGARKGSGPSKKRLSVRDQNAEHLSDEGGAVPCRRNRLEGTEDSEREKRPSRSSLEAVTQSARWTPKARKRPQDGPAQHSDGEEAESGISKRARIDETGRVVSKRDGRVLVANNPLRQMYQNSYHCPSNTRQWAGHSLDLGQAFKLAVWTQYGPHMPTEKSGNLQMRTALFRTAAYYALSLDGKEEKECIDHADFPEFLSILVFAAKQMRYNILTEGRIYFGDHVFTPFRASKKFQREFVMCSICFAQIVYLLLLSI